MIAIGMLQGRKRRGEVRIVADAQMLALVLLLGCMAYAQGAAENTVFEIFLICCLCVAWISPATNVKHSQDQQLLLQGSFEGPLSFSERAIAQLSLSKTASSAHVCKRGSIVRFQMAARVPEIFHAGVRWYLLIGLDSLLLDTFVFLTPAPQSPRTAH
jgi:hypothetical protein